ncbi:unnamed protein product, partial [Prunus brigantina]
GKVHGSLARAGKVRGQTPKVAKQDKKKKPRGRAHKRMQYNRRFVTAVVGFGKKRGPNSSEKHGGWNVLGVEKGKSLYAAKEAFDSIPAQLNTIEVDKSVNRSALVRQTYLAFTQPQIA